MKVFISSTREDLETYRIQIREFLQSQNHEPLLVPDTVGVGDRQRQARHLIDQSDAFIGIYAHRYGSLPRGEHKSFVEQEYDYAFQTGKAIACYIIDPAAAWPDEHREDDFIKQTRLDNFRNRLRQEQNAATFSGMEDILQHLLPEVKKWSDVYDRLKHLNAWSVKLPPAQKMQVIVELTRCYHGGRLSEREFVPAIALIAENFGIEKSDPAYPLVEPVEKLLRGALTGENFAAAVQQSGRKSREGRALAWFSSPSFLQKNYYVAMAIIALLALVLGFVLGSILSGNDRVSANDFPVTPALAETANAAGAVESAAANASGASGQERGAEASPPAAPASQDAAGASARPARVTPVAQSTPVPPRSEPRPEPPSGGSSPGNTASLIPATEPRENATAPPSAAANTATQPADDLPGAALANPEALVVCEAVNPETRLPEGTADTLRTATIWMWTRIATQRPEEVRAEWYFEGQLLGSKSAQIPVASPGYRIYFSRYIGENVSGSGQLKLYNGNGELIGERAFFVDTRAAN